MLHQPTEYRLFTYTQDTPVRLREHANVEFALHRKMRLLCKQRRVEYNFLLKLPPPSLQPLNLLRGENKSLLRDPEELPLRKCAAYTLLLPLKRISLKRSGLSHSTMFIKWPDWGTGCGHSFLSVQQSHLVTLCGSVGTADHRNLSP